MSTCLWRPMYALVSLPALKAPQVFTGGTATVPQLVPAARPITIRHLLTHTSGFAYGLAPSTVDARLPQDSSGSSGSGFGVSIRLDHAGGAMAGSVGEFGWSGAATTSVSLDPQEKIVAILLTQHLPFNQPGLFTVFSTMVNAGIE